MEQLIECVPNFSEGNDVGIINQLCNEIASVAGVRLLNVDQGKAANRTVVTFVGAPSNVCEAAFKVVKKAGELIDMGKHKGEHPRIGATDVCPLVPVSGIGMDELVVYARGLAERIGNELGIPVYCYEYAAFEEKRRNLANCRAGEYEGLPYKLASPDWKPDFGPDQFNAHVARTGATAVSARKFLIAYNVNLNTTSVSLAKAIASEIREKGRVMREGDSQTGSMVTNKHVKPVYEPGMLKSVKGIGWYIEEYGIAQLSFNLTDITVTSMHEVFEAACQRAEVYGLRVTGSELIGMIPLQAMLDAGTYFLKKQQRSVEVADEEVINIAVKSLGLDELAPFDARKRIIEYVLEDESNPQLIDQTLRKFVEEVASDSITPGGGSVLAYMGALGAALGTMAANLSARKRGLDHRWEEFSAWAEKGKYQYDALLELVDEDTRAYNSLMEAYRLSKGNENEKYVLKEAIEKATRYAIEVPLKVMELCLATMGVLKAMVETGNPNSKSDAGVGALAVCAAARGSFLNIRTNAKNCTDSNYVKTVLDKALEIEKNVLSIEMEILLKVEAVIS